MKPSELKKISETGFLIEIDFDKNSYDPARVFRTMTDLISCFQNIDKSLVGSISSRIEPAIMLEDIQTGSLKTWLVNIINEIDDDALHGLDWKPLIGKYLVKGKYLILSFLDQRITISNREEIKQLQSDLQKAAEETGIRHFKDYSPISEGRLMNDIQQLSNATKSLSQNDKVIYKTNENEVMFNLGFNFVPESIEDILTKEIIENTNTLILKVKKPDYLGNSMWEFKHENRAIEAKILDQAWLNDFQNRRIDIRPGDAIKATVWVKLRYGFDANVISIHYEINEVLSIIHNLEGEQTELF